MTFELLSFFLFCPLPFWTMPPVCPNLRRMKDAPIVTQGKVISRRDDRTFNVELKNGKQIIGHTPKKLAEVRDEIKDGYTVTLEMTPFDFEKGRIVEYSA